MLSIFSVIFYIPTENGRPHKKQSSKDSSRKSELRPRTIIEGRYNFVAELPEGFDMEGECEVYLFELCLRGQVVSELEDGYKILLKSQIGVPDES